MTAAERGEDRYRHRLVHGAQYFTSRQNHDGLAVMVKRFPPRHEPREDDRVFVLVHGIGVSSRYFQPLALTDYLIRCGLPYLVRQVPHMLRDGIETRVGSLRARVLIVNGDRDAIVATPWARELSELGPSIDFREVQGPHVIMQTDPAMIARHIVEFMERP